MKRAIALLVIALPLLWFWLIWGCIFIVGLAWQVLFVSSVYFTRVAKGYDETFCGVWNLHWDESFSTFVWAILRKPM